jgi:chromosome partitioning protein
MRMNTTLVINPKGGSGKTTIAVNLASRFASENIPTTLMDYDPQGSSLHWLRSRGPTAPKIHGANGAPGRYGHLRSFEMYVPPQTRHLIIDAPAGASGILVQEMIDRAHCVVVPVVPSPIDIHATGNFIRDLLGVPRVRMGQIRVAVVANKVRASMPAYQPFLHFLGTLNVRLQARLLDSDVYVRACETGIGIFEMEPHQTLAERRQFGPLAEWVIGEDALRIAPLEASDHEVTQIRRVSF